MKKTENKSTYSKIERWIKRKLWKNGFLLVYIAGFFVIALLLNAIALIIILMLISGIVISNFQYNHSRLKSFRNSPDLQKKLQKKTLTFEKDLWIRVNKLLEEIKILEGKLSDLEVMYNLLEDYELLKNKVEDQKDKQHFQNFRLNLDTLKYSLGEIKKNYDENIKSGLKILWITKPRALRRKIKELSNKVNFLSTQCEEIEVKEEKKRKKKKK